MTEPTPGVYNETSIEPPPAPAYDVPRGTSPTFAAIPDEELAAPTPERKAELEAEREGLLAHMADRAAERAKVLADAVDEIARAMRPAGSGIAETLHEDWALTAKVLGADANPHQRLLLLEHIARVRREAALRSRDEAIVTGLRAFLELSK